MSRENLKHIYFLTRVKNLGDVRIKKLLSVFEDPREIFGLSQSELSKIDGIERIIAGDILRATERMQEYEENFEKLEAKCEETGTTMISITNEEYPQNLKMIFDAPVLLFYKGNLTEMDKYSISVVGTRVPSEYGKIVFARLVDGLSQMKIPLISGMASGIDSVAHHSALKNGNVTYAVLGSGIDVIYPPENKKLYDEIVEKGAVISEQDFGAIPDKVNFPRRNRIISGISIGTLVVESAMKGGSLITAHLALDQNREVFAVPGYINSNKSMGTNELIKKGYAKMVTKLEDILVELEYKIAPLLRQPNEERNKEVIEGLTNSERAIYTNLDYQPMNIDSINMNTGLPVSDCLVNLLSLELKGLVKQIPGKNFIKV